MLKTTDPLRSDFSPYCLMDESTAGAGRDYYCMYSRASAFNHTSYLFSLLLNGGKKARFERLLHILTLIYSLNFASTLLMYMSRLL